MPTLALHVDNLKCGGCAATVRRRLGELPGVVSTTVDPDAGLVTVVHDGSIERTELAVLLHKLGYPISGTGGVMEKAKSYLSCAVGRFQGEE